tara:strand:- start:1103 stop:1369 length:267 start_codon:yes stop_codon:yes gene_type:complete
MEVVDMSSLEARKLRQFIEQQDQTSRYILLLHYYDNLTVKEIGLVLDLPQSIIQSRLTHLQQRARQQILRCQTVKPSTVATSSLSAIA